MLTTMARIPLHTLPAFRAVAKRQNLRAAAEVLHLTHSAVSQQIKLLEEQIGFPLFDRSGRSMALNAAGAALLHATEAALAQLDDGLRAAAAAASGDEQRIRLTLLPSFGQRWLLPRIARWRARHPAIALELDASQRLVDLQRDGFHAALRQGTGPWRGLVAERLIDSPRVVVAAPDLARRLRGEPVSSMLDEPLLGDAGLWHDWFAAQGIRARVNPVASFNDAGLMLQATEQGLGLALTRELLAADALRDGRLQRISARTLAGDGFDTFWFVYPPALADWTPLRQLLAWLREELAASATDLAATAVDPGPRAAAGEPSAEGAPSARQARALRRRAR
jgi:LysR family transcriptional regulator, glycine cleavage system transcriptional activator